ncbi:MAG TPA: M48 family metalloprotease [Pseudobdellovibrionaceae bacterium]|nr:M48 family metalloprotease [Pseudobdellovibrionaceae bacterium]
MSHDSQNPQSFPQNNRNEDQEKALANLDAVLKQWTSTPMGRRSFLASMGLLMASCGSVPEHRQREGNLRGDETSMTVNDERKMTAEVLPQMRKDYPAVQNADVQNYVSNLGRRLAIANKMEGNPYNYNFTAVDVGYVNAFALPAGTIFVTTPLLAMADTEAELAGVLGHEMGHVKARHTAIRMEVAKREESKSWMYAAGGGILGAAAGFGLGKLLCRDDDQECKTKALTYGAAAGVGGGLLVQKYGFMANSREDEMEADRVGFRVAVGAGYNKDQVGTFYEKLLQMEQSRKTGANPMLASLSDALSTHPPSQERVNQMKMLASQQAGRAGAVTSTRDFDRIKKIAAEIAKAKQGQKG